MNSQELEVKFYVGDLCSTIYYLEKIGAEIKKERVHEINLRFDTKDCRLGKDNQVLRLRQDNKALITYKGPGSEAEGVLARTEIEFTVDDFQLARKLLEALEFEVYLVYEKYRTTYSYHATSVTLDEMPYGNFVEIEGSDSDIIHEVSNSLKFNWSTRITDSYTDIFEKLCREQGYEFRDLTFENFLELEIKPEMLGVNPSMQPEPNN